MKKVQVVASAVYLAFAAAGGAFAQQPPAPAKVIDAASKGGAVAVTATVAAVDVKNRVVTLKGPEGNQFAVDVPAKISLAKVKVGDSVDISYIQAVALDFQKGDGIRMMSSTVATDHSAAGALPAGAVMRQTTVVTNIWAMDAAKGTVTVLGPYGQLTEVHVKDPAQLQGVKVGDQMKITFTRALATALVDKG